MSALSYSSYHNDIISFNIEEYIQNLHHSINEYEKNNVELFNHFVQNYKDIENEDFKKPIFSQTSKFKKIPNHIKNYKYLKINREKYNSLFLTNYRENKRKRISFELAFKIFGHLLENLN
jgi:hypothetical protein